MKGMNDTIHRCMIDEGRDFSDTEIVDRFFKMGRIDEKVARQIVEPILGRDRRFSRAQSRWRAVRLESVEELPLSSTPFLLFAIDEIERTGTEDPMVLLENHGSFVLVEGGEERRTPSIPDMLDRSERYVFLPHDVSSLNRLKRIYRTRSPLKFEAKTLSLKRLLAHFFPDKRYNTWDDIIRDFSILNFEGRGPESRTRTMAQVLNHILSVAMETGVQTAGELTEISNRIEPSIDFSRYGFDREYLRALPENPGVYRFHNRENSIIYVGKTRNLRVRVGSYFRQGGESEEKRTLILQHLHRIEYEELGSDLEALIVEYRLIDRHRPVLNRRVAVPERRVDLPKCILLLPSVREDCVKLYFLSMGNPLLEAEYRPGVDLSATLRDLREDREYRFDPLKIIALTYLKRYEERMNVIGFDLYGTDADLVRVLDSHWREKHRLGQEKVRFV
jgi:hypothetical protein